MMKVCRREQATVRGRREWQLRGKCVEREDIIAKYVCVITSEDAASVQISTEDCELVSTEMLKR
jgi:hypothetical protein